MDAKTCLGNVTVGLALTASALFVNTDIARGAEPIPQSSYDFLETYCLDCHDDLERKGEINLEALDVDWKDHGSQDLWERAIKVLESGEMPPEDERQPSKGARSEMVEWIDASLLEHAPIGGAPLRRLNRREYQNTLNQLLGVDYDLPEGFPQDSESRGFDNQGDALTLSGPLLQAYSEVATGLAEKLFPPPRKKVAAASFEIPGSDFTYAYSAGSLVDERMRLVSSTDALSFSASWPSRFEASTTGIYQVQLDLSAFNPPADERVTCRAYAVDAVTAPSHNSKDLRLLGEFSLSGSDSRRFEFEALLEKGETVALRYHNASLKEDRAQLPKHLKQVLGAEPLLAAAYKQADGRVARGRVGWDELKALMQSDLLPDPPTGEALDELIKLVAKNLRSATETIAYKHFEEGPALEIRGATIHGPIELAESKEDRYWKARVEKLLGPRKGRSDEAYGRGFLERFLPAAFRRPVPDTVVEEYWEMVRIESERSGRLEDGLHYALRTALKSPHFLFRGFDSGPLDDYGLASRLSYFLTNGPPDRKLLAVAAEGKLGNSQGLLEQVERLLASKQSSRFVKRFLDQWLDLAALETLTPDRTLFPNQKVFKYTDVERKAIIDEANLFFAEVLNENLPLEDFIDPDFTYTNASIGEHVYELPQDTFGKGAAKGEMLRVSMERGGRFGGVLGMAGVMMSTANGVDTQPVLRGVWLLENIMGAPVPAPPNAVPALTPDTSKATTPKEMLAAHMGDESCAGCHKRIDPLGFVMESFDPIGRWRTEYPAPRSSGKKAKGAPRIPVDTTGVLPDGTPLRDVRDLKTYLVEDITPFARCLSEKLLTYATGRRLTYSDRKLIETIVAENEAKSGGFKDLFRSLVDSESFRMK